jgi:hypothetical protein
MKKGIGLGRVNLAEKDGSMYKKTLLCRVGSFDGLYGPVDVSRELLESLATNYNRIRSSPQNENDYAPILKDHERKVDFVMGRLLADLEIAPWIDPETNQQTFGMYGTLRIDDEEAKKKVDTGAYAHVSISFDDEKYEIFEVSFVAVEAARRSMVLSKGENKMNKKVLALAKESKKALAQRVKAARDERKKTFVALAQKMTTAETEMTSLSAALAKTQLGFKAATIKGQFNDLAMQGKIVKAEIDALDFTALAAMDEKSFAIVLKSYESRTPSKDIITYGQKGTSVEAKDVKLSNDEILKRMEAQKKGVALQTGVLPQNELQSGVEPKNELEAGVDKELADKCMSEMKDLIEKLSKVMSDMTGYKGEVDKLAQSEDEEEKKELAAEAEDEEKEKEAEKDSAE